MSQTTVDKHHYNIEGARSLAGSFSIMFSNPPGPINFCRMINCERDVTS